MTSTEPDKTMSLTNINDAYQKEQKKKERPKSWAAAVANSNDDPKEEKDKNKKKDEKKPKEPTVTFREFFRYADGADILFMIFGGLGAIVNGAIFPAFSFVFGLMLDSFNESTSQQQFLDKIAEIAVYFVYCGIASIVVNYLQNAFWNTAAARQIKIIREAYLRAIMRQEVGWFDQHQTGELITRIASDTIIIQEALGDKVSTSIQYLATCVFGFTLGFIKGWKLSLVMLAVTPLIAIAGAFMMKMMSSLSTKGQEAYAKAGAFATEVISGIRTVASFAFEPRAVARYIGSLADAKKLAIKSGTTSGLGMGITYFIFFGVYGLALWYGSELVKNKEITGGDVLTVFFCVLFGAFALGQASPSLESVAKGMGAAYKIYRTIDRRSEIDSLSKEGKELTTVKGNIEFKSVCFAYPTRPDATIFKGLDLKIEAGEKVALVGHSGNGKSTVIQMILRFYDPDAGKVTIDGKNIKKLNLYSLRQNIGLVSQEPVLFTGTIADNIRYGKEDATLEEVMEAAKASNAHEFIMGFPDQYNTQVGEKGAQLSGGQKQRIAIARAIIKNPKILLLDEATSALDSESEKVVQDALDSVMQGRTTVIVAHRLSTIRDASKIIVLEKGQVVEMGKHDELMAKSGMYYELVKQQMGSDGGKSKKQNKQRKQTIQQDGPIKEKKEEKQEEENLAKVPLTRLVALNKPEIPFLIIGAIASGINGSVQPIFSILFSEMVKLFYQSKEEIEANAWKWAVGFCAIGVAPLVCNTVSSAMFAIAGQNLIQRLRELLFRSVLRHNIGWFDRTENSTGFLTTRLASEATLVEGLVGTRLGLTVQNICTIIVGLTIAFIYGWELTLLILGCSPFIAMSNMMHMSAMKSYTEKQRKVNEHANQVATEAIMNIRTIFAFTYQDKIVSSYQERMEEPTRLNVRSAHIRGALSGIGYFLLFGSEALGFWFGGWLMVHRGYTFERVLKVFMAVFMLAQGVGQTAAITPDATKAGRAASVIFGIIDHKPEIDSSSEEGQNKETINGDIELSGVTFVYPTRPDVVVLKEMDLKIKAGQVVALVGPSGSGKSSVIALLERFYDPQSGQVKIDGVNIKDYNLRWLRKQIGLVSQEPVLFTGSIAENISYGKSDATQDEIVEAAKAANAHEFIMGFPDQYNTQVGEKGAQLSGGQKQRIAIARAIIKNPKILLLDEATSALDAESEKVVQAALDSVMQGRTTIIVAHRLSTVRNADQICVIDSGKIQEMGKHEELMQKNGIYYALVERQTQ